LVSFYGKTTGSVGAVLVGNSYGSGQYGQVIKTGDSFMVGSLATVPSPLPTGGIGTLTLTTHNSDGNGGVRIQPTAVTVSGANLYFNANPARNVNNGATASLSATTGFVSTSLGGTGNTTVAFSGQNKALANYQLAMGIFDTGTSFNTAIQTNDCYVVADGGANNIGVLTLTTRATGSTGIRITNNTISVNSDTTVTLTGTSIALNGTTNIGANKSIVFAAGTGGITFQDGTIQTTAALAAGSVALLNSANGFTALNTFNAGIAIPNGINITLGTSPNTSTISQSTNDLTIVNSASGIISLSSPNGVSSIGSGSISFKGAPTGSTGSVLVGVGGTTYNTLISANDGMIVGSSSVGTTNAVLTLTTNSATQVGVRITNTSVSLSGTSINLNGTTYNNGDFYLQDTKRILVPANANITFGSASNTGTISQSNANMSITNTAVGGSIFFNVKNSAGTNVAASLSATNGFVSSSIGGAGNTTVALSAQNGALANYQLSMGIFDTGTPFNAAIQTNNCYVVADGGANNIGVLALTTRATGSTGIRIANNTISVNSDTTVTLTGTSIALNGTTNIGANKSIVFAAGTGGITFQDGTIQTTAATASGVTLSGTNVFTALNTFNAGISIPTGQTLALSVGTGSSIGQSGNNVNITSGVSGGSIVLSTVITGGITTNVMSFSEKGIACSVQGVSGAMCFSGRSTVTSATTGNVLVGIGTSSSPYNSLILQNDSIVVGSSSLGQNSGTLTLTTNSTTQVGVRINSIDVSISGTTTNLNATSNYMNGNVYLGSGLQLFIPPTSTLTIGSISSSANSSTLSQPSSALNLTNRVAGGSIVLTTNDTAGTTTNTSTFSQNGLVVNGLGGTNGTSGSIQSIGSLVSFYGKTTGSVGAVLVGNSYGAGQYGQVIKTGDSFVVGSLATVPSPLPTGGIGILTLTTHNSDGTGGVRIQPTVVTVTGTDIELNSTNPPTTTATMPASNDSSTKIPTTAWVQSAVVAIPYYQMHANVNGQSSSKMFANVYMNFNGINWGIDDYFTVSLSYSFNIYTSTLTATSNYTNIKCDVDVYPFRCPGNTGGSGAYGTAPNNTANINFPVLADGGYISNGSSYSNAYVPSSGTNPLYYPYGRWFYVNNYTINSQGVTYPVPPSGTPNLNATPTPIIPYINGGIGIKQQFGFGMWVTQGYSLNGTLFIQLINRGPGGIGTGSGTTIGFTQSTDPALGTFKTYQAGW
jgi:phage tail protein X